MNIVLILLIIRATTSDELPDIIPPFKTVSVEPFIEAPIDITSSRIKNGRVAARHSKPFQAYLDIKDYRGESWSCSGVLITRKFALTAAHCLEGAHHCQVVLGMHTLGDWPRGVENLNSYRWEIHPLYKPPAMSYDIAILFLEYAVKLSNIIGVVKMPHFGDWQQELKGYYGTVSGWGATEYVRKSGPLLEVTSKVISHAECRRYYGDITYDELCLSGEGGKSSCNGDSGGPMLINGVLAGLVSYGSKGCSNGYPHVYTRIDKFLKWIVYYTDLSI